MCVCVCVCVCVCTLSHVRLFVTLWTVAHQAPLSLGFPRQEYWSGLPFPSPVHESEKPKWSRSVVSDPQRPHGLQPTRLLHPWDFPGKSTGVGCHCLLHHTFRGLSKSCFFITLSSLLLKHVISQMYYFTRRKAGWKKNAFLFPCDFQSHKIRFSLRYVLKASQDPISLWGYSEKGNRLFL